MALQVALARAAGPAKHVRRSSEWAPEIRRLNRLQVRGGVILRAPTQLGDLLALD